jgi:hypothetical protein
LADVCGGHPTSIEYVVLACNTIIDGADRKSVSDVIRSASRLIGAYRQVDDHETLLKAILLGEKVRASDRVGNETYESLVNRGVLLHSLNQPQSSIFVPMCPELFLHAWILSSPESNISLSIQRLLGQILELRGKFSRKRFENLHCSWEQLIRLARPADRFKQIPLRNVYCVKSADNNSVARASCPVDASAGLKVLRYEKDDIVIVELNSILSPTDEHNAGWDRLIFYEAFPSNKRNNRGRKRFALPVFIQNKFSAEGATTKLTLNTMNASVNDCKTFLTQKCRFNDCVLIPEKNKVV